MMDKKREGDRNNNKERGEREGEKNKETKGVDAREEEEDKGAAKGGGGRGRRGRRHRTRRVPHFRVERPWYPAAGHFVRRTGQPIPMQDPSAPSRVLASASDKPRGAGRGIRMTPCPRNFIPGRRILLEGARFLAQDAGLHGNTKDPRRSPGQIPEVAGLFVFFSLLFRPLFLGVPWRMHAWACSFFFSKDCT